MALTYYLTIDGIVGTLRATGTREHLTSTTTASIGRALVSAISGGAGRRQPEVDILAIDDRFNLGSGLTDLLKDHRDRQSHQVDRAQGGFDDRRSTVYELATLS